MGTWRPDAAARSPSTGGVCPEHVTGSFERIEASIGWHESMTRKT